MDIYFLVIACHIGRGENIIKNLFFSNKREFFPGKAYLIEGKGIEQVREKILEWLDKKEIDILYDHDNLIEGYASYEHPLIQYDTWIYLKLLQESSGTVVVFHHKPRKKYGILLELRKQERIDLIRFIEGKEELNIDIDSFHINFFIYPGIAWFSSTALFFYVAGKLFNLPEIVRSLYGFISMMAVPYYFYYNKKRVLSLAKLPKHYVEEYDKEIDFFISEQ